MLRSTQKLYLSFVVLSMTTSEVNSRCWHLCIFIDTTVNRVKAGMCSDSLLRHIPSRYTVKNVSVLVQRSGARREAKLSPAWVSWEDTGMVDIVGQNVESHLKNPIIFRVSWKLSTSGADLLLLRTVMWDEHLSVSHLILARSSLLSLTRTKGWEINETTPKWYPSIRYNT